MPVNTLSLKQRLAALNTSINASTSQLVDHIGSPTTPTTPKWLPFLGRRSTEDNLTGVLSEDQIQEVMSRVVFQAGVDYESVCHSSYSSTFTNKSSMQNTTNVGPRGLTLSHPRVC